MVSTSIRSNATGTGEGRVWACFRDLINSLMREVLNLFVSCQVPLQQGPRYCFKAAKILGPVMASSEHPAFPTRQKTQRTVRASDDARTYVRESNQGTVNEP